MKIIGFQTQQYNIQEVTTKDQSTNYSKDLNCTLNKYHKILKWNTMLKD